MTKIGQPVAAIPPSLAAGNRPFHFRRFVQLLVSACLLAAAACAHQTPMTIESARLPCRQAVPDPSAAVTWVRPASIRDRARLDRWCDAVGPMLVELTPPVVPPPTDRLAIVVWNVRVGGGDVGRLIRALRSGAWTGGTPVASFVLLLQETYREGVDVPRRPPVGSQGPVAILERPPEGARRSVVDIARDNQLAVIYAPSMRNAGMIEPQPAAEDRGNAIVSTLPMTDPIAIELPFERQRRVVVAATVHGVTTSGQQWRLLLANAHLDTSVALTRGGPFGARRRHAAALVEALAPWPLPTVLAGDFNSWMGDREPAVQDLRRAFGQTPPGSIASTWYGPLGVRFLLDRVFVRNHGGDISVRRLPDRFGSDHYPLLALVDVRAETQATAFPVDRLERVANQATNHGGR